MNTVTALLEYRNLVCNFLFERDEGEGGGEHAPPVLPLDLPLYHSAIYTSKFLAIKIPLLQ